MLRVAFVVVAVLLCCASAQERLPPLNVDLATTSVGGLSAGAFFAVQMHVAYSDIIKRAAIFAGGPYHCAEGDISKATTTCMSAPLGPPNVNNLVTATRTKAAAGQIAAVSNLEGSAAFLWGGNMDYTVRPVVMKAAADYYHALGLTPTYITHPTASHTMPTDDPKMGPCAGSGNWISNCNYDGAGEALKKMYGSGLKPRSPSPTGRFIHFDQTEFGAGIMAKSGYAYVPKSCDQAGSRCKLHVNFHGCQQYAEARGIGMVYVNSTGWNRWADTNDMVVLYPQMSSAQTNGCFNWFGYFSDGATYDTRQGSQMKAVKAMMDRLASPRQF